MTSKKIPKDGEQYTNNTYSETVMTNCHDCTSKGKMETVHLTIIRIVYKMPGRQNYSSGNYYVGPDRNCRFLRWNKNYTFLDTHVPC